MVFAIRDILLQAWNSVPQFHDDVIKWKYFPRYWPFKRGVHRSPVNYPHKGHWREAWMFSLICARINASVNNLEAGDLRRHHAHYDVSVMSRAIKVHYCPPQFPKIRTPLTRNWKHEWLARTLDMRFRYIDSKYSSITEVNVWCWFYLTPVLDSR